MIGCSTDDVRGLLGFPSVLISRDGDQTLDSAMQLTLGASPVTFTLLYLCLLTIRVNAERLRQEMEGLKQLPNCAHV